MKDLAFIAADGDGLVMDFYYPEPRAERSPAVVIVHGYNDVGFERMLGSRFKDSAWTVGWGQKIAASGMVAIAYTNRQPLADAHALFQHIRENAAALGVDENRIGIFASSGHGPVALSLLMSDRRLKCAALLYPYAMDLDGSTAVAEAQKMFKFDNACEGKSIDDLPAESPIFIARAGKDQMPRLNEALDRFVARALARNMPVSFVDHAEGPHAFDLTDDSEMAHEVIRGVLTFLRSCLLGAL